MRHKCVLAVAAHHFNSSGVVHGDVIFTLADTGMGAALIATGVDESIRMEMVAGWVSVLMAMKAAVDHGIDLRNHDASRSWGDGYADN